MADREVDQIVHDIARHRADLATSIVRLRASMQAQFDPRERIRTHPRAAVLLAFGAGLLLRWLLGRTLRDTVVVVVSPRRASWLRPRRRCA